MYNQVNVETILAILFFISLLTYNWWYKLPIKLLDIPKYMFCFMGLLKLFMCLFYLVVNPKKATEMNDAIEWLTIALLFFISLTISEIYKPFRKKKELPGKDQ